MALAQNPTPPAARPAAGPPANPRDLSGKWLRTTPFQTFSNVKGGANEFQNEITQGRKPDLNRDTGLPSTPSLSSRPRARQPSIATSRATGSALRLRKTGTTRRATAIPWAVPRMLNGQVAGPHAGWSVLQTADKFIQFSGWHHHYREVWTDGRPLPPLDEAEPRWNGYSVGRWQGNTFVVDSLGFDPRTWLDHNGYPHTDQMRLQERYQLLDAETLELRMTMTYPEYYAKPFESDVKLFRRDRENEKGWDEQIYCVPSEEQRFNRLIRDGGVGK